jgi:UDP-N-acetyl-2-amino-2-deoxyglucuronate dehydrogenase
LSVAIVRPGWRYNRPVRVGILGAGNISETHARAASAIEGTRIVAVHGANAGRAGQLAAAYNATAYPTLDAFLSHRPMDVVAIGSPSGLHAEQGAAACARGLHVLVEKPIDVTVEKADRLIEAARAAGVTLGVFFQDHVQPDLVRLHEAVQAGRLGRPLLASARVKWYRPPEYYGQSRWRGTWALDGGGALMNQGIHTADLLLWLLGPARRVAARTATALHAIEVEDTAVALIEFDSGAVATLEATTAAFPGYRRRLELTGTEGTVIVEHDRLVAADLRHPAEDLLASAGVDQNASASSPVVSDARGHQRLFEDFFDAIRTKRAPRCSGPEARRSVALVHAIYQAGRTGAWVSLERH